MNRIHKLFLLLAVGGLGFAGLLQAAPVLSETAARERLKQGALVIDVRTAAEFQAGHLTNVINIPLDQIKTELPKRVPDQGKVLLLHCRSGRRSAMAEKELRALGYTNAFNLGSFEQAQKILSAPDK